ncbi:MAG: CoA-transferase, partial [Chloroflexota bacterium]
AEGRVGYARALVPDVALMHAWVADRAGNVIIAPPMNENMYGAMAARNGAVVTVEKIVSTDFIRRHADLVRLPSQYVRAIVEAPHGNHPGGMYGMSVPELEGYAEDLEWILECRRAFRKPETADAWIKEWMLDLPDHAAYPRRSSASPTGPRRCRTRTWTRSSMLQPVRFDKAPMPRPVDRVAIPMAPPSEKT